MWRLPPGVKDDPARRWALPDRIFFAGGACHLLAAAFLDRHGRGQATWLRPRGGPGHHVVVLGAAWAFDASGLWERERLLAHLARRARRWWPGWEADAVPLDRADLTSEARSRRHAGLWLREPGQFLHDAMPRARAYAARFPAPP